MHLILADAPAAPLPPPPGPPPAPLPVPPPPPEPAPAAVEPTVVEPEAVPEEEAEAVPQAVVVNPTVAEPEVACLGKPFGVIDLEDEIPLLAELPKCLVPDSTVAEPAVNAYQPDADVTRALVKLAREIGEPQKSWLWRVPTVRADGETAAHFMGGR